MKTSVTLHSPDRNLFGITVRQQTKTGFLSLSDLQSAYNLAAEQYGWQQRRVDQFFQFDGNRERLYELLSETKKINVSFLTFTELIEKEPVRYLKSLGIWKATGRGVNKTVSTDPYVWVSIAMWMNPKIYAKTVIWLTDSLLFNRVAAGGMYTELNAQLARLGYVHEDYKETARAINFVAFGRHENGLRDTATSEQLAEIADIEKKLAYAVEAGYLKSKDRVIGELRNMWSRKFRRGISGNTSTAHAVAIQKRATA